MQTAALISLVDREAPLLALVFTRITTTLSVLGFLRRDWVPPRILVMYALSLTVFVYTSASPALTPAHSLSLHVALFWQVLAGLCTGLLVNLFLEIFVGFGQLVSMQAGLGFVNFYVPGIGTITPLSRFFLLTAIALFFQLNGHLVFINMLIHSLDGNLSITPPDSALAYALALWFKHLFSGALLLSLAALVALMVSNLTIAIMTRFSPQLNIFSIGINLSLIVCFLILYLGFDFLLEGGRILLMDVLEQIGLTFRGFSRHG